MGVICVRNYSRSTSRYSFHMQIWVERTGLNESVINRENKYRQVVIKDIKVCLRDNTTYKDRIEYMNKHK